jgi:phage terminase large subunit-like protein
VNDIAEASPLLRPAFLNYIFKKVYRWETAHNSSRDTEWHVGMALNQTWGMQDYLRSIVKNPAGKRDAAILLLNGVETKFE